MLPFGGAGLFNIGKTVVGGTAGALLATSTSLTVASIADVATGQVLISQGAGVLPIFSGAPTLTTSLTSPIVYGSSSASGTLTLQSTSNSTRSTIGLVDQVLAVTAAQVYTTGGNIMIDCGTGGQSVTTGNITALRYANTLTVKGASASTSAAVFNGQFTITDDGTARAIGPALVFASQPTFTATVAGDTAVDFAGIPAYCGHYHSLTLNRSGAGTGTMTTAAGVYISTLASIGTGWTVTNYCGMLIDIPGTLTGTMTNFYGVKNNGAAATGRWFLYETGGMQSSHKGNFRFGDNTAPTAVVDIQGTINTNQTTANGTVATAMSNLGPAAAHTTIQEWLTIKINGTTRFIPCF